MAALSTLILLAFTLLALAVSYRMDPARTRKALMMSWRSFVGLVPMLLAMTGIIGLVLALVSPDALSQLFQNHGPLSFALVVTLGSVAMIPAPIAFPMAGSLLELGASPASLAAFITTLTMVGVVTIPLEIEHFGRRFTMLRQGISLVLAVAIGLVMGVML